VLFRTSFLSLSTRVESLTMTKFQNALFLENGDMSLRLCPSFIIGGVNDAPNHGKYR